MDGGAARGGPHDGRDGLPGSFMCRRPDSCSPDAWSMEGVERAADGLAGSGRRGERTSWATGRRCWLVGRRHRTVAEEGGGLDLPPRRADVDGRRLMWRWVTEIAWSERTDVVRCWWLVVVDAVASWVERLLPSVAVTIEEGGELRDLNPLVVAVILGGLDRPSASPPGSSPPAAMAAGLGEGDGAPYGCSGGAQKIMYLQCVFCNLGLE
ncbi:hypothetical protein ACLOJK_028831 [Asimina triloba]